MFMKSNAEINILRILHALIMSIVLGASGPLFATTITVTNTADALTIDGDCTLREAIIAANTDAAVDACNPGDGADEIIVPAGTYLLEIPGTNESASADGDLNITTSLEISGAGSGSTIIDGNGAVTGERVFTIGITGNIVTVAVSGITVQNGTSSSGGGILNVGNTTFTDTVVTANTSTSSGGGIHNLGKLTLNDTTVTGNTSVTNGGGINNLGTLTIIDSIISENTTTAKSGGGISHLGVVSMTITDSTIRNNTAMLGGGGIHAEEAPFTITGSTINGNTTNTGNGGGIIANDSQFTITGTTISENGAPGGNGGGVDTNIALAIITGSTLSGNTAGSEGGGINNTGNLSLTNSTVSDNTSVDQGGGIKSSTILSVTNSTISGNSSNSDGGGIKNVGNLIVTNSTISGNSASNHGGGVWNNNGALQMNNVTLNENTADNDADGSGDGGGLYSNGGTLDISNTLIAGNTDDSVAAEAPDCFGDVNSLGNNLLGNETGCSFSANTGDIVGTSTSPVNPLLGPLVDNGGTTNTQVLLDQSPAIDTGNDASCETTDQRGFNRPRDGDNDNVAICDIGAFELDLSPDIIVFDPTGAANDLQIDFSDRELFTSPVLDLTISNNGKLDLNISRISGLDSPFSFFAGDCITDNLPPQGNCTITVQFLPVEEGTFSDSLDIISNDPDENPVTVNVSGNGVFGLNNNPPTAPVLVSPENGTTGLEITNVTFQWNRSTDPDGDPVTYDILICTDPSLFLCPDPSPLSVSSISRQGILYASLGTSGMLLGIIGFTGSRIRRRIQIGILILAILAISPLLISCEAGISDINVNNAVTSAPLSVTFGNFDPATTYYWKIIAVDGRGGNTSSAVRNFTTK